MSNLVPNHPAASRSLPGFSRRMTKTLTRLEENVLLRQASLTGTVMVGKVATQGVAEIRAHQAQLAKAVPQAQLDLALIGDAVVMALHAQVLDLGDGL